MATQTPKFTPSTFSIPTISTSPPSFSPSTFSIPTISTSPPSSFSPSTFSIPTISTSPPSSFPPFSPFPTVPAVPTIPTSPTVPTVPTVPRTSQLFSIPVSPNEIVIPTISGITPISPVSGITARQSTERGDKGDRGGKGQKGRQTLTKVRERTEDIWNVPLSTIKIENLTIYSHLDNIMEQIKSNAAIAVKAPTGSGKSLGIPWRVVQEGAHVRIFISVPTIAAAMNLAHQQKSLSPHIKIGYAAERDIRYDDSTQIIYATSGHMRLKFLRGISSFLQKGGEAGEGGEGGQYTDIDWATVLILDEAHSGSIDNAIIYGIWKQSMLARKLVPRLVISSATLDISKFVGIAEYSIEDVGYNVSIQYHNKSSIVDQQQLSDDIIIDIAKVVDGFHTNMEGHFLIFAAGESDINRIINMLKSNARLVESSTIIPLFAALDREQINLIYEEIPGKRKIIVATNIAETAITIKDVTLVIDTMLEKISETSTSGGLKLTTTLVSKSSADQRKGRTGRTKEGICYRMIRAIDYTDLINEKPSEIERVPIYSTVMELLAVGLDTSQIVPEVTPMRLQIAIDLLKKLGMVDEADKVTDKGYFASKFELSVRNSSIIFDWIKDKRDIFSIVSLLTMIDSYGPVPYFYLPRKSDDESKADYAVRIEAHKDRYFKEYIGYSDVHTMLNLWLKLMNDMNGVPQVTKKILNIWSTENSMNAKKINEAYDKATSIMRKLISMDYNFSIEPFEIEEFLNMVRPYINKAYEDNILTVYRGTKYKKAANKEIYGLDNRAYNLFDTHPPLKLAAIIINTFQTARGDMRIISVGFDIEKGPAPDLRRYRSSYVPAASITDLPSIGYLGTADPESDYIAPNLIQLTDSISVREVVPSGGRGISCPPSSYLGPSPLSPSFISTSTRVLAEPKLMSEEEKKRLQSMLNILRR